MLDLMKTNQRKSPPPPCRRLGQDKERQREKEWEEETRNEKNESSPNLPTVALVT